MKTLVTLLNEQKKTSKESKETPKKKKETPKNEEEIKAEKEWKGKISNLRKKKGFLKKKMERLNLYTTLLTERSFLLFILGF